MHVLVSDNFAHPNMGHVPSCGLKGTGVCVSSSGRGFLPTLSCVVTSLQVVENENHMITNVCFCPSISFNRSFSMLDH